MSGFHNEEFPVGALYAAAGLIGISLIAVFSVRAGLIEGRPTAPEARAAAAVPLVKQRKLLFRDREDGALVILETGATEPLVVLEPGSNSGFIRGVMRGLMRERTLKQADRDGPVTVALWADGALTLTDDGTGRIIELGSFGRDNREAFAAILDGREPPLAVSQPFFAAGAPARSGSGS
jgi:putative photosynthetic complex assembly protein